MGDMSMEAYDFRKENRKQIWKFIFVVWAFILGMVFSIWGMNTMFSKVTESVNAWYGIEQIEKGE